MANRTAIHALDAGNRVESAIFAVNYLADRQFHSQTIEADGLFPAASLAIGATGLRYPGGTITEKFFDIADDRHFTSEGDDVIPVENYFDPDEITTLTPLISLLRYASELDQTVTVVIPTIRYYEDLVSNDPSRIAQVEQTIKQFISRVLASPEGAVVSAFEIGNEYPSWIAGHNEPILNSSSDFAMITRNFSVWIEEAINASESANQPLIIAQAAFVLHGSRGNNQLLDALFNEDLDAQYSHVESVADTFDAIDGVSVHSYPLTAWTLDDSGEGSLARDLELFYRWQSAFDAFSDSSDLVRRDLLGAVTEWNTRNAGMNAGLVEGLQSSVATLTSLHRLVSGGFDQMNAWPVLHNTSNSLVRLVDDELVVNFNGAAFFLAKSLLDGLYAHSGQTHYDVTGDGEPDVVIQLYSSVDYSVVVVSSISDQSIDITFDLPQGLDRLFMGVPQEITLSSSTSDPTDVNGRPTITSTVGAVSGHQVTGLDAWNTQFLVFDGSASGPQSAQTSFATSSSLSFAVEPELTEFERSIGLQNFDASAALTGSDESENLQAVRNIMLHGADGDDKILGTSGNDQIAGGRGSDTVVAGDGDDFVMGSEGGTIANNDSSTDIILAGAGNDTITAIGAGQGDYVSCGVGDDTVYFDSASHLILGEGGNDTFNFIGLQTYGDEIQAQNVSSASQIGTNDVVSVAGFRHASSIVVGGNGYDVLNLSDGNDAFFLDDGVAEYYDLDGSDYRSDGRLLGLEEMRCGNGDDLIDLTSSTGYTQSIGLRIYGGSGRDTIWGSELSELIDGGAGRDYIYGGAGQDTLRGGGGDDVFVFTATSIGSQIRDFDPTEGDRLLFVDGGGFAFDQDSLVLSDSTARISLQDSFGVWSVLEVTI